MLSTSRTPLVKKALEEMEKVEDEVRFFLRRTTTLLTSTPTETGPRHFLSTPPSSDVGFCLEHARAVYVKRADG